MPLSRVIAGITLILSVTTATVFAAEDPTHVPRLRPMNRLLGQTLADSITVDVMLSHRSRAAVLGHELRHAVEVVRAPGVTDESSFAALYHNIGWLVDRYAGRSHFETSAAQRAGARV